MTGANRGAERARHLAPAPKASSAIARRLGDITTKTGVKDRDVARLVGTSPQTVNRWRRALVQPLSAHRTRILDLAFLADGLAEFYDPDEAHIWLFSRQRLLSGRRPVDLIEEGEIDPVLAILDQLGSGAFA
jgi:uncharacterized protein (DUF2384 family)